MNPSGVVCLRMYWISGGNDRESEPGGGVCSAIAKSPLRRFVSDHGSVCSPSGYTHLYGKLAVSSCPSGKVHRRGDRFARGAVGVCGAPVGLKVDEPHGVFAFAPPLPLPPPRCRCRRARRRCRRDAAAAAGRRAGARPSGCRVRVLSGVRFGDRFVRAAAAVRRRRPFARPATCGTGAGVLRGGGVTRGGGVGGWVGRGVGVGLGVGRGVASGAGSRTRSGWSPPRSRCRAGARAVHQPDQHLVQRDGERDRDDHACAIAPEIDHCRRLRRDEKATPGGVARSSSSPSAFSSTATRRRCGSTSCGTAARSDSSRSGGRSTSGRTPGGAPVPVLLLRALLVVVVRDQDRRRRTAQDDVARARRPVGQCRRDRPESHRRRERARRQQFPFIASPVFPERG